MLILCVATVLCFVAKPYPSPNFICIVHASSPEELSSLQEYSRVTTLMMVAGSRVFRDESRGPVMTHGTMGKADLQTNERDTE